MKNKEEIKKPLSTPDVLKNFLKKSLNNTGTEKIRGEYPIILVHGMGAWGDGSPTEKDRPYWGESFNMIPILREMGYKVHNPTVGSFSSAWDRACDLFAVLTGTKADYGAAHSKKFHHQRYGRDYTDCTLLDKPWDMQTKLHLVGHSFGGETIRLFTYLLEYGDAAERECSKDDCSPLFQGGHSNLIHSITTLASPHNGSPIANVARATFIPNLFFGLASNIVGVLGEKTIYDFVLDQWKLSSPRSSNKRARFSTLKQLQFALSKDNCIYDLTLKGAQELNKRIKKSDNIYYFSYTNRITQTTEKGRERCYSDDIFNFFKMSYPFLNNCAKFRINGKKLSRDWQPNDGIVPVKSGLYPFEENHTDFSGNEIKGTGIWHIMPTLERADHFDFCSVKQDGDKDAFVSFYRDLFDLLAITEKINNKTIE
ncbi:MAG: hypothetical protein NC397_00080 [Clostridium sp.]|nr:hypothetical protein [Clostridium sp.]